MCAKKANSKSSVLILLDLSAAFDTQSSDPPVHPLITGYHWDYTSLVWILSHWSVFQGGLGRGGIQSTSIGHWGSPGLGSWTPPLLHIHYITGSHHTGTWLLLPFLCWWHTARSLISTRWSNSSCTDLRLISAWMKEHHLQLNLAKTELLVFPATPTLQHDFTIQLGSSTITPSASVRNLGVIFDDQLTFKEHIAKTARSCRFALHNIRKIRSFLTEHAAQLLVQALVISRLDYCNALLAGLPSNTIKPLQIIQNAAARLVFNEPKRAHVTPLFVSLHWLPVAARIQFRTLMLAYRTTTGSAPTYFHSLLRIYIPSRSPAYFHSLLLCIPSRSPTYFHSLLRIYIPSRSPAYFHSLSRIYIPSRSPAYFHSLLRIYIPSRSPAYFHSLSRIYIPSRSPAYFHSLLLCIPSRSPTYFHSLLRIYIPSRSLRSASERRLVVPSQRGSKSLSRTFSFTVPGRWNDPPPPPSGPTGSLSIFKQQLKTHLFQLYLTSS